MTDQHKERLIDRSLPYKLPKLSGQQILVNLQGIAAAREKLRKEDGEA